MKANCKKFSDRQTKKKELKNKDDWKLSVKQVFKGACLINGDGGGD